MIVLLVVDMQVGLFEGELQRHDADGVVGRINQVAGVVREKGGAVVFIQHDGPEGDSLEPETPGWEILPSLERMQSDPVVRKRACDPFYETALQEVLDDIGTTRLIVTGCATDFCVDSTVRSAASKDYDLAVVEDAHTTGDRPHLDAKTIITHHNWLWENLILPGRKVNVAPAKSLIEEWNRETHSSSL